MSVAATLCCCFCHYEIPVLDVELCALCAVLPCLLLLLL
jgi:hypothetical protein